MYNGLFFGLQQSDNPLNEGRRRLTVNPSVPSINTVYHSRNIQKFRVLFIQGVYFFSVILA